MARGSSFDQFLSWGARNPEEGRRLRTRLRPEGHSAAELWLMPKLGPRSVVPTDVLEIHRSVLGPIVAINVWGAEDQIRQDVVLSSKVRVAAVPLCCWVILALLLLLGLPQTPVLALSIPVSLCWAQANLARTRAKKIHEDPFQLIAHREQGRDAVAALPGGAGITPPTKHAFETLFVEGREFMLGPHEAMMRVVPAGMLSLPSGRLVTLDPFSRYPSNAVSVPAGRWPVTVELVDTVYGTMVCAARVRFASRPVASFARAGRGAYARALGLDVRIDGGIAAFADAEAVARLHGLPGDHPGARVDRRMRRRWKAQGHRRFAQVDVRCAPGNAVLFESGEGDGTYPSYFELDAAGAIIGVVLDFGFAHACLFGPAASMNLATQRDAEPGALPPLPAADTRSSG